MAELLPSFCKPGESFHNLMAKLRINAIGARVWQEPNPCQETGSPREVQFDHSCLQRN